MDSRTLLAPLNFADSVALSGGSWAGAKPLANLQSRYISRHAESTGPTATITGTFPKARKLNLLALVGMNCSPAAAYSLTVKDGAGATVFETIQPVWSRFWASQDLDWDAINFWTGAPIDDELERCTTWPLLAILPADVEWASFTLTVEDPENKLGRLRFGRLFVGRGWQFKHGVSRHTLDFETGTQVGEALGGAEHFDVRETRRIYRSDWEHLPRAQVLARTEELARRTGIDREVFIVPDPGDPLLLRWSFMGRFTALSSLEQAHYRLGSTGFAIREIKG